ncbi:MAG: hypothetical protein FWE11_04005 [Defluviitaleaceae bacterium]|nr:hypothetical protein [Defluviitaleaceae bacterium]
MRKFLALVALLVVAAFIFTACGNNDEPAATPEPVTTPTPEPTAEPTPPSEEDLEVDFDAMEPVTLTIHYIFDQHVWDDDWRVWEQIRELTGVTLVGVADDVNVNAVEVWNLEAAEGFPADIYGGTHAPRFIEFGMQGAFIPLNDLIAEHAPYFSHLMERFPEIRAAITAPDGNIYHMPNLNDVFEQFAVSEVYWIRQDWLDILELDIPDTIEELEYVLSRFRDDMPEITGNDWVAPFFSNGTNNAIRSLGTFWGARTFGNETQIRLGPQTGNENTIVHYWIQPEFKVAIQNISRWYQEGLIDVELFTRQWMNRQELFGTNQGGMLQHFPMSTGDFNPLMQAEFPDFLLVPFIPPTGTHGTRWSEVQRAATNNNGWAITPHNPHPERTVQLMDFLYHGIGRLLLNFGPQGVTWDFDADGEPEFLPYVTNRDQGVTVLNILRQQNGAVGAFPYMADLRYELRAGTEWTTMAQRMYEDPAGYERGFAPAQFPVMRLPFDEQLLVNDINAQLNLFLDATIHGFILNDWTEIEDQWDAFVDEAISMGILELEEIWQRAYDNFRGR